MNNRKDKIYEGITKYEAWMIFLIGGGIGILLFLLFYGPQVLDVTNEGWLLSGADMSQHYIGWKFYRETPWHFPIGQIDGILYPDTSSIVFSDSIPLMAIPFKILSPILPETFQYFGIWGCLTYFMTGGLGALILRRCTDKIKLCFAGSVLFCLSPYIFHRMYVHSALGGHWILLAALAIWLYRPYFSTFLRKFTAWGLLLITGSLVHIYFIPMIMLFMFGFCLQDLLENKKWLSDIPMGLGVVALDLIVLYVVGAFGSSGDFNDEGLGKYSANVNSLINSNNRGAFLEGLPILKYQDEGFGYLGLGILILLGIAICVCILYPIICRKKKVREEKSRFTICVWVVLILSLLLAWSPKIMLGTEKLLEIQYPEGIEKLLSTFRASGRFIWCTGYILMTFAMMTVCRYLKQAVSCFLMIAAIVVQGADMQPMIAAKQESTHADSTFSLIQSEEWETLAEGKKHLVILPYSTIQGMYGIEGSYEMGNFAVDHGMTVNFFPLARTDMESVAENDGYYLGPLRNGAQPEDSLYIFNTYEDGEALGLQMQEIDGCFVGTYRE